MLAVWSGGPNNATAWIAAVEEFAASFHPSWVNQQLAVSLYDSEGQRIFGESRPRTVFVTTFETHLPFIVSVTSLTPEIGGGRVVLVSGLALAFLAMVATAYGLHRTTTREILLARRQSDFISAVSHEF